MVVVTYFFIIMMLLFVGTDKDIMSDMHQVADIFFAVANVLSFARIAHLLPANEQVRYIISLPTKG